MIDADAVRAKFVDLGCAQIFDAGQGLCWKLDLDLAFRGNGRAFAGPAVPVSTSNDMLPCLIGLKQLEPGGVLLIQNLASPSLALFGDIFARAAQLQGAAGVLLDGAVRDTAYLRSTPLAVRATQVNFIPAKAAAPGVTAARRPRFEAMRRNVGGEVVTDAVEVQPGDWLFVDDDGVLLTRASDVRMVVRAAQILDRRERGLRDAISPQRPLADLIGLEAYLVGEGPLRSRA
jgi:regulator of RNase E activity RraA